MTSCVTKPPADISQYPYLLPRAISPPRFPKSLVLHLSLDHSQSVEADGTPVDGGALEALGWKATSWAEAVERLVEQHRTALAREVGIKRD